MLRKDFTMAITVKECAVIDVKVARAAIFRLLAAQEDSVLSGDSTVCYRLKIC